MLRVNAIPNTAAGKAYYRQNNDYYIDGQDHEAFWHGKGAELLGLEGKVEMAEFDRLCENKHPETGEQLTAKHIANRRVGYDFTWSVSKSVSLMHSLGADQRLAGEFRGAVAETMAEMERDMSARVRRMGADHDRQTGNMIWADFLHQTSRPIDGQPDPQLHIHAVVFNATYDREEGQWKAGQFGELKRNAPYYQAVFRARLANRLQAIGYSITKSKDDFEITGVPERVIKEFSRRTGLIEKTAEELGVTRPETKAKLGATTREAKKEGQTWASLLHLWRDRVTPDELEAIEQARTAAISPRELEPANAAALDFALRHLLERSSAVTERELMTTALKHGMGQVTPEGVLQEIADRKDLIRRKIKGVEMVSTKAVLAEEDAIIAFAQKGKGRWRALSDVREGEEFEKLSPTQQNAVRHAWRSRDRLILIRGAAGTGKTTLTKALLAGVEVPYVVLAPSAEASRGVLRREGVDPNADTLAKFLLDEEMQSRARGGLIVLDEASLAGSHDVYRLIQLADQLGARVLALGDRRQHRSVSRGDILALLEDSAKIPVATVGEIRRQAGEYREAVQMASEGNGAKAIQKLDELGWLKQGHDALVEDYMEGLREGKSQIVVSPTHAEGNAITERLRDRLKTGGRRVRDKNGNWKEEAVINAETERTIQTLEAIHLTEAEKADPQTLRACQGYEAQFVRNAKAARAGQRVTITAENAAELAKEGSRFIVYRPGEIRLAPGDTIRMTANVRTGEHRLNNGAVYQVKGFDKDGLIELNNGWKLEPGVGHITHGLVVTSHAAQGRTTDRVLVAMGDQSLPAVDQAAAYVSLSRGKQACYLYADDREALLEAADRERPRVLASELVRQPAKHPKQRTKKKIAFLSALSDRIRPREPDHDTYRHRPQERGREHQ